jgi:hypothetical protein
MPGIFGSKPQENTLEELKRQVAELQNQIQLQSTVQVQTGKILTNVLTAEKEDVLYKWNAPDRIFVKKDKQWYWTAALVVLIVAVILLILGEAILVGAVFSMLFVLYVAASVPPAIVDHSITSLGIRSAGQLYRWEQLDSFWFAYRLNKEMLNIDTKINSPKRLTFFFTKRDKSKILDLLKDRLQYKQPPEKQGWVAKNADGIYIPLTDIEASVAYDKQYEKAPS